MIKIGAKPGHDERGGAAGTVAHRRATVGIFGQLHLVVFLHARQHLGFDVFGEHAGHRVIFFATLVSLGIAATVGDHNQVASALHGARVSAVVLSYIPDSASIGTVSHSKTGLWSC